jgi:hypothetical protein
MRIVTVAALLVLFCVGLVAAQEISPNDWSLSYKFRIANPMRKLVEVQTDYTFPARTGEVMFILDDVDNHYTRGYRKHIRAFTLRDSHGERVDFVEDTAGLYRASELKGSYTANYIIVMDHYKTQSVLGIDDTPLMWGAAAIFPGASIVVYPKDADGSRIGNIDITFEGPENVAFITPYERIGESSYRVGSLNLLRSEFWALGDFDVQIYEKDGDSVICGISRVGLGFSADDLQPRIDSILDFYVSILGTLPPGRISMTVYYTPSSGKTSGTHNYGAVGKHSFNCLMDEKTDQSQLDDQMGLIAYNLLSFWTPGYFRPASTARLDWFTTGVLNYMQLKSMLRLGFISRDDFLARVAKTYTSHTEQLRRKGLSLFALLQLPNSDERSIYSFMMVATFDLMMHNNSGGEMSIETALNSLSHSYGGTGGYTEFELFSLLKDLDLPEIDSLLDAHFRGAEVIDLDRILEPYGVSVKYEPSGDPQVGLLMAGFNDLSVEYVEPGGPAQLAGIEFGDVLSELRGFKMSKASDLTKLVAGMKPGDKIDVGFERNGEKKKTTITLGNRMLYRANLQNPMPETAQKLWESFIGM